MTEWLYGRRGKRFCHQCRIVAKQTKKELDCEVCSNRMPDVSYELQALLHCFTLCEYQLKMGFSGAYALDYATIIRVADDLGIQTNNTFYQLLKAFESVLIKELNKDNKSKVETTPKSNVKVS